MKEATKTMPVRDFVVPQGVLFTYVDPKTGKLTEPEHEGARYEPFIAGTEPTQFLEGVRPPDNFGLDDYDK
jgi:membrane carboxypeptidase/penicillin-binding protein